MLHGVWALLERSLRFGGLGDEDAIGVFVCIGSLFVCAVLHLAIGNRLRHLAAQ